MNLSRESAEFLLGLLNAQQLSVGAADFEQAIGSVLAARVELRAIVAADSQPSESLSA